MARQNPTLSNFWLCQMHLIKSSCMFFPIKVNSLNPPLDKYFSRWKGFLNKAPPVWLDGARPSSTCIPPSFLENMLEHARQTPNFKNTFKFKKLAKFRDITFLLKKTIERVQLSHFWQQWVCWTVNLTFSLVLSTWYIRAQQSSSERYLKWKHHQFN